MKRRGKIVMVAGFLLALLGVIWWLSVPEAQGSLPPRLSFVGFTNGLAGEGMAVFSVSNVAHTPILFGPFVEVQTKDGSYEHWAAGPPERPATALAADAATTFATQLPDLGSPWRLRLIWQLKPTKSDYTYADDYPRGLRPSARTWQDIVFTPEMLHEHDAEPTASPNGGPTAAVGNSGVPEGRHR